MSLFERGTKRWTGSPAAPVGFGAAKARCPVNRWRGRSGRKRSGWSADHPQSGDPDRIRGRHPDQRSDQPRILHGRLSQPELPPIPAYS